MEIYISAAASLLIVVVFPILCCVLQASSYGTQSRPLQRSFSSFIVTPVVYLQYLCRRLLGVLYLVRGPSIIKARYQKAHHKPFTVNTPSNDHVLVSTVAHIQELNNARSDELSLHAVAKELLQPKYTMNGFEWQNERGVEGTGFVRALRSILTANLPTLLNDLEVQLEKALDDEIATGVVTSGGGISIKLFPAVKKVVSKTNCLMFFGRHLSQNEAFVTAAMNFPQDVVFAAECLRITPGFLSPFVAYLATSGHNASRTLVEFLSPVVQERLAIRAVKDGPNQSERVKPVDCMQWLIETSPRKNPWTASRMISEIIALWFGSVHQLAMSSTYAIEHLCLHGDIIEPLRDEFEEYKLCQDQDKSINNLPLLNSFTMESFRTSSSDAISCRRKALKDFVFSDGTLIKAGDWVCLPLVEILNDSVMYNNPTRFNISRFSESSAEASAGRILDTTTDVFPHHLTDVTAIWPIWGIGKTACPGRFYASHILKILLIKILTKYDIQLHDASKGRCASWRSSIVPISSTRVIFSPRPTSSR